LSGSKNGDFVEKEMKHSQSNILTLNSEKKEQSDLINIHHSLTSRGPDPIKIQLSAEKELGIPVRQIDFSELRNSSNKISSTGLTDRVPEL
jgi:hypothetical protein